MTSIAPDQFDDPIFGRVTFNPRRLSFETFWQFKGFNPYPDSDPNDLDGVDPRYRELIENWQDSIAELRKVCRRSNIVYALRHRRICELSIGRRPSDTAILDDQRVAFSNFIGAEEEICRTILDAIVHYYHTLDEYDRNMTMECLTQSDRDWFFDGVDRSNIERMCRFDGIQITPHGATTPPSLAFTFQAAWDYEHGFGVVWRDGRVVGLGCSDEVFELMGYINE